MDKIYCISAGDYSDWHIAYSFKDKNKRDALLKVLGDDYLEYDISLDDDRIDVDNVFQFYTVSICNYSLNRIGEFDFNY